MLETSLMMSNINQPKIKGRKQLQITIRPSLMTTTHGFYSPSMVRRGSVVKNISIKNNCRICPIRIEIIHEGLNLS